MNQFLACLSLAVLVTACAECGSSSGVKAAFYGVTQDGDTVIQYTLTNASGAQIKVIDYGCRITNIIVPDREGKMADVVLGYENLKDYEIGAERFFGALLGRYANRINQGRFSLDEIVYQLPRNNYGHCLHGGPQGFQYRIYRGIQVSDREVKLTYLSKNGEEGFPGNLNCTIIMKLTDDNAIDIQYEAETDKPTVVNMTNHSYFNLDGDPSKDNSDYLLTLNADYYTPVDSTFMTTGEIVPVEGTPMDFRLPAVIGTRINQDFEQLRYGNGIDHNWVLNTKGDIHQVCATLESPVTGIVLNVYTDEPGIQVYCGNFLDGTLTGKKNTIYNFRASVCLETQKYPDTPNKADWPTAVVRPGEKYQSHCIYKFSVHK